MGAKLWTVKSVRLRVACCIALALTIEGLMRSNLNMAIVCMMKSSALSDSPPQNGTTIANLTRTTETCPLLQIGGNRKIEHNGNLYWTSQERAIIFASFYLGGFFATIATEPLNRLIGATRLVLYGAIVNVIGTFMTPFVAEQIGPYPLVGVRLVMGFGQGLLWPCMSVLIAQWFPTTEKSTALAIATTGNQLSVIIAMFATAELCQLPLGWPMAFHTYGVFGIFLCAVWYMFVADSPAETNGISQDELNFITNSRQQRTQKANWPVLLTSRVVWSIAASSFAHTYITVGIVTYLPLYYKTVLNMSLTSNGIMSALPFVGQLISKVIYAGFADEARKRKWISFNAVTKLSNSSASFGMGICFALLCFCDCTNRYAAVFLICIAMAFVSGYIPGYNTSVVTVAPSQTAAIAAFSRIFAQIAASLAPYHIGATTKLGLFEEWRNIFVVISVMCFVTGIFFHYCVDEEIHGLECSNGKTTELIQQELITDDTKCTSA